MVIFFYKIKTDTDLIWYFCIVKLLFKKELLNRSYFFFIYFVINNLTGLLQFSVLFIIEYQSFNSNIATYYALDV